MPDSFVTQTKLLSLNLTNNLIDEVRVGAFANMTRLVRLILTRNRIKKLERNSMAGETTTDFGGLGNALIRQGRMLYLEKFMTGRRKNAGFEA